MSLLADLNSIAKAVEIPVGTGVFSGTAPKEYLVLTPLTDTFDIHADNSPGVDVQEVRLSLYSTGNYIKLKNNLIRQLIAADITITDRRYIGHDPDSDYHHYAIDVAQYYEMED